MIIVALFPVAPPRLMDLGFLDAVTPATEAYRVLQPSRALSAAERRESPATMLSRRPDTAGLVATQQPTTTIAAS